MQAIVERFEQWHTAVFGGDSGVVTLVMAIAAVVVIVVILRWLGKKRVRRARPGARLRENMERMRRDAPFKDNEK